MDVAPFRVDVPGGTVAGHDFGGEGKDVLLVGSVGHSEANWFHLAPQLARHARVASFSLRAHGRSTCELGDDLTETLRDLERVADDRGMERPVLIAHDFGGGVASLAAALFPGRFAALCVIDSPVILPETSYRDYLAIFALPDVQRSLGTRFGLGASGDGADSLGDYLDVQSERIARDWLGNTALTPEQAREWLLLDTIVEPSGTWQRRPTVETCCRLAAIPDDFFAYPGRELLATLGIPIWVMQPEKGTYAEYLDGFDEFAAGRAGWGAELVPGGNDALQRDEIPTSLIELLDELG